MRSTSWLAGLMLAWTSTIAMAATPSYDYLQLDYVRFNPGESDIDFQGADFVLSALLAPHLFFDASYEFLESDSFQQGLVEGRIQNQTVTAGLGGRLALVRNLLDGFVGADFVYQDSRNRGQFEGIYDDEHDTGFQVKGGVRANFGYFEAIPQVRYIRIYDGDDLALGIQLLGCPGYGLCVTGGYEYFTDSESSRYFAGLRFYYD